MTGARPGPRALGAGALLVAAVLAAAGARAAQLQRPRRAEDPERAKAVLEAAIAALGGERYLSATSEVGTGTFTAFDQGRRGVPIEFVDTFVYPDKNRTEFGKKKHRVVQSNAGDAGWKYDGSRDLLEEQTETEVRAFRRFVRGDADNILRRYWREPGVKLFYLGVEEVAPRQRGEGVALEYEDGFRVEIYFDPATHLPVLTRYHEGSESGAPGSLLETRYHIYLDYGGIKAPRTVDLYKDQSQTARVVYDSVRFNVPVDASFFERPASAKALDK